MLRDFTPNLGLDLDPDDLSIRADPDVSLLIDSAALCKFLGKIEDWGRKRDAGELFTSPPLKNVVKRRHEMTPEPVEEEDGFVFGEEELSVHARYLVTHVGTADVDEESDMVKNED